MLSENIKSLRRSKGFTQEELAVKLNVVRQTVSKWEQGLSAPDSEMLISISEVFETPVSDLIGETIAEPEAGDLKAIAAKLEVINLQLANRNEEKRRTLHRLLIALCAAAFAVFAVLIIFRISYLIWDYSDPEYAVLGSAVHAFVWLYVRLAPIVIAGSAVGAVLTRQKRR